MHLAIPVPTYSVKNITFVFLINLLNHFCHFSLYDSICQVWGGFLLCFCFMSVDLDN